MTGIVVATADDFLRTYKDGVEKAERYYQAMDLLSQRETLDNVARVTERGQSTILNWKHGRQKPQCVNGLEALMGCSFFDPEELAITTRTPGFRGIHYYAMLVHVTGTFRIDGAHFQTSISTIDEEYAAVRRAHLAQYGLETKMAKGEIVDGKIGFYVSPKRDWAVIGRALYALGVPPTDDQRCLPRYIKVIIEEKPAQRSAEGRMLRQAARIFFEEHFYPQYNNTMYGSIKLRQCSTRQQAQRYAEEVVSLFNMAMPRIELGNDAVTVQKRQRRKQNGTPEADGYKGTIRFRKQVLLKILRHHHQFLQVQAPRVLAPQESVGR